MLLSYRHAALKITECVDKSHAQKFCLSLNSISFCDVNNRNEAIFLAKSNQNKHSGIIVLA